MPPSTSDAEENNLSTGPSSRTAMVTTVLNWPPEAPDSEVTAKALRLVTRRSSALAKHSELAKKLLRPDAAAASRAATSFCSVLHCGAQRTSAVALRSHTGDCGDGDSVTSVLAHAANSAAHRLAEAKATDCAKVLICRQTNYSMGIKRSYPPARRTWKSAFAAPTKFQNAR